MVISIGGITILLISGHPVDIRHGRPYGAVACNTDTVTRLPVNPTSEGWSLTGLHNAGAYEMHPPKIHLSRSSEAVSLRKAKETLDVEKRESEARNEGEKRELCGLACSRTSLMMGG